VKCFFLNQFDVEIAHNSTQHEHFDFLVWDGRKRSAKTRARVYLDVLQLSGISRRTEFYAIGDTWFGMDKVGLVLGVWEHEKMQFIINASSSENRAYLMKKYNIGKKLY
jgi:hypothetical protein